jgi:hypothetical protein
MDQIGTAPARPTAAASAGQQPSTSSRVSICGEAPKQVKQGCAVRVGQGGETVGEYLVSDLVAGRQDLLAEGREVVLDAPAVSRSALHKALCCEAADERSEGLLGLKRRRGQLAGR